MSKVKIQGNASGTGVLTVTAPNTDTDRTITLPDSTDTLAVNSDVTNKLPLAGGTLTGNLNIGSYTANSNADNLVIQEAGDFTGITLAADNDQGSNIYFADPEDNNVGGITYNHTSDDLRFRVNGTEKARIISSGGITFNGDTASANALDDYEEGAWTPAWNSGSNGRSIANSGSYTKIGNRVHVSGMFVINGDNNTGSGDVSFSGLPFTSHSSGDYRAATSSYWAELATSANISGWVQDNSQLFYFRENGTTGAGSDLGNHIDQDTYFWFSATYQVA